MSKENQDETLYCERCGISFLWSVEEQRTDKQRPLLCAGCHRLLPPPSRERGLVKWFSPKKQYGFIVRSGKGDLFAHRSQLLEGGPLHQGDLVEFSVAQGEQGEMAVDIRVLESAPEAAAPRHTYAPATRSSTRSS